MKRNGFFLASAAMIFLILSLALAPAIEVQAEKELDAKCTGGPDVPWSEQIVGCTRAIESGKYAGKDLAKAYLFRCKAHGRTGDIDLALADIEQAIRLNPNDSIVVGGRGDIYLVKKDYQHALADYTKATSLDPNNALAFVGRGMAHIATRDLDSAIADFEQAVQVQPTSALALYWRGIAKRLKGDAAAAEADIASAKKIDPEIDR